MDVQASSCDGSRGLRSQKVLAAESSGFIVVKTWYTVKGLFRWFIKESGESNRVEERVVLFRAENFDDALDQAEREGKMYCKTDRRANFGIEPIGWWHAYQLS